MRSLEVNPVRIILLFGAVIIFGVSLIIWLFIRKVVYPEEVFGTAAAIFTAVAWLVHVYMEFAKSDEPAQTREIEKTPATAEWVKTKEIA